MTGRLTGGVAEGRVRHGLKVSRGAKHAHHEDALSQWPVTGRAQKGFAEGRVRHGLKVSRGADHARHEDALPPTDR